jgi:hypothetical protein
MYPYPQASSSITEQRHDLTSWLAAWRQWQDRAVADLQPRWAMNHQIVFDLELTQSELERAGAPPGRASSARPRPPTSGRPTATPSARRSPTRTPSAERLDTLTVYGNGTYLDV